MRTEPEPSRAELATLFADYLRYYRETAIAKASAVAGENRTVSLSGANVAQQALNAGLVDEIHVELVPVLLGEGIRFFDGVRGAPVMLEDPEVIEGKRVTHLIYRVVRR